MSRDLTDALSKLFIKLGGKTSDSKENKGPVDYIDDITDIVKPDSGSEFYIVTFTFTDSSDGNPYSCNRSFEDIKTAIKNGKIVMGHYYNSADDAHYYAFISGNANDDRVPSFNFITSTTMEEDGSLIYSETIEVLSIDRNDAIYHTGMDITYDAEGNIWD